MRATVEVRAGAFTVRASVAAEPGEVVALVGPNGAGKTTLLRGLAGLAPATGPVLLDGVDVAGLPPERRGIGWVAQGGLLFPHLSARDNVAYGLRGRDRRGRALRALEGLGIADLADRRPAQLSGGQAARVALARALVTAPRLVLLDEPLAALDATTRADVRRVLRAALSGGPAPALVVTHDPVDALALADRVVVLEDGAVVQDDAVAEVARRPRTAWVAGLMGLNAWRGVSDGVGVAVGPGVVVGEPVLPAGTPALVLVAPSAVSLHRTEPEGSARNRLRGPVTDVTSLGGRVRVTLDSSPPVVAEVTPVAAATLGLGDGGELWASFKAVEVQVVADGAGVGGAFAG
ncbi:MAG: ABC transporter ATP-binding protein [Mycobacteriales bacterium]|nr:ABC transporter ATP-binding protein [Mycobacteriales bacterium]